jgi:uncharacterized membrane protein YhiD involved in acid resistance
MTIAEASITGLFRTLLILIGAFVLLRFIGQLMNAKRNMDEEHSLNKQQRDFENERKAKQQNLGKTSVLSKTQNTESTAEDIDFKEVD